MTKDVDGDGLTDMDLKFERAALGFEGGETEGELTGSTVGGTQFVGKDAVEIKQQMCVRTP
jgi:hypothetical protein